MAGFAFVEAWIFIHTRMLKIFRDFAKKNGFLKFGNDGWIHKKR